MTAIRHIASQLDGDDLFVTAEFERRVRVWSLAERRLLAEIDTVLSAGGHRVALSGTTERPVVVAGASDRDGICGYDALLGDRLWRRNDLERVQGLAPLDGGSAVGACFEDGAFRCLDARTGETKSETGGVRSFFPSSFGSLAMTWVSGRVELLDTDVWERVWHTAVEGFALLDAAFSPGAVAVTEVVEGGAGLIHCFDLSGQLLWRFRNPPNTNARSVAWDAVATEWVAVVHHVNHESPDMLVRVSVDGVVVHETPLGVLGELKLLPSGRHLVAGTGHVLDAQSAQMIWDLPLEAA